MKPLTFSRHIDAPPEAVFRVFTDFDHATENVPSIKKLEIIEHGPSGAVGQGTKWRETRMMFGKEATETMWITRFDPPRGYTVESDSCGAHYMSNFAFRPENGGTQAQWTFEGQGKTFMARFLGAVLFPMMKGVACKALNADLDALKAVAERRT